MYTHALLIATLLWVSGVMKPVVCGTTVTAEGAHVFLEAVIPVEKKDTLVSVRLCLVPPRARVGSYSATLTFDSTQMRVLRVDVSGGMQVANVNDPGSIRLAGAAPGGFPRGPLATIAFKPSRGKALGKIRVTLIEANSPTGATLLADSKVSGYPLSDRTLGVIQQKSGAVVSQSNRTSIASSTTGVPRIDSMVPNNGHIDAEGVLDVLVYGRGFAARDNSVLFDAATVDGLASDNGGTVIHFMAPTMIPEHGNTQRRRVGAGTYAVKVRTPGGTSNAVTFTVRGGDR